MKLNFQTMPKFTRNPSYRVTTDWKYLLSTLERWTDEREGPAKLNLDPDFQRGHVWTEAQQIAYVEYVLQGGISGRDLYFNCTGWQGSYEGPFVIVDGKQRLNAVLKFLRNELPIFGGHLMKDIEGRLPTTATFNICVNDLKTRAEVLQWYLEMNTGGTPHTEQEIEKVKAMLTEAK
jgi:uncharacterized protein with ParB-like and HNH nuclease domain